MAGDWIKFELSTLDKPEVMRIGRELGLSKEAVCGYLIRFWGWLGSNSVDGAVDGVVGADVDVLMSLPGFSDALEHAGWVDFLVDKKRLIAPNFARHNGESSKKRALKSSRQARWREAKVDAHVDAVVDAHVVQKALPEKRREEKRYTHTPSALFEQFWQAYPKRKSRADAEKAFAKVNPDEQLLAVMLAAIAKAKTRADWQREGGQFIPYPASWLNSKGWLDEDSAPAPRRVAI